LLPVGRSRIDYKAERVYVVGMTKEAEALPEFTTANYDYENRGSISPSGTLEASAPLDTASSAMTGSMSAVNRTYNRDTYTYEQDASLYDLNAHEDQTFKLYQERLIASKTRVKTGESRLVTLKLKLRVSVPLEKERVVIESYSSRCWQGSCLVV